MTDDTKSTEVAQPPASNTVTVNPGGPMLVQGDLDIIGAPEQAPGFRASLCSCGLSANKPYCDGTHRQADVEKTVAITDPGEPLAATGGTLTITPSENGPLRLAGNMTITVKGAELSWTGTSTALCRCGNSANKPFCDGSHRSSDFTG